MSSTCAAAASAAGGSRRRASPRWKDTSSSASPPDARSSLDRLALAIATGGGAGYSPIAPGTAGSAVALVLLWMIPFTTLGLVIAFVAVTLVGTWAAGRVESGGTEKDPGIIVIDEVAGMALSVLAFPRTPAVLLTGFVLFRALDVIKPFPADRSQALPGGPGVMADDLIAGCYVLLLLGAARAVTGYPA